MGNSININGIVILRSYHEAIKDLDIEDRAEFYDAIFNLVFEGKEVSFTKKYLNSIFKAIEPNLASSINRYNASVENGKKGGRKPSTEKSKEVILEQTPVTKEPVKSSSPIKAKLINMVKAKDLNEYDEKRFLELVDTNAITTPEELTHELSQMF